MQIAKRGADNVRITVQGKREANACFEIKNKVVDDRKEIMMEVEVDVNYVVTMDLETTEKPSESSPMTTGNS